MTAAACVLEDGDVRIRVLPWGCALQAWEVAGHQAILGYRDADVYRENPYWLGAIVGRVANRIAGARFSLGGETIRLAANDGRHCLHGGTPGLARRRWEMESDGHRRLRLSRLSPDGEDGFPGNLRLSVTLTLEGRTLSWDMRAEVDRPTPVSLAQHAYFSLGGGARDYLLQIPARAVTETDAELIPTGRLLPCTGALDFSAPRAIGRAIDANFVPEHVPFQVRARGRDLRLDMTSDQPGLQVYTAHGLRPWATPLPGQAHTAFSAICLEPQGWPDAINRPHFPSILATPEAPYRQRLSVTISPVAEIEANDPLRAHPHPPDGD